MFETDYIRVIAFAIAFFICMMGIGLLGWGIVLVGGVELLKFILVGMAFLLFIFGLGWFMIRTG